MTIHDRPSRFQTTRPGRNPRGIPVTFKAPFPLPARFLTDFGYRGGRRYVALYWEPCGDESCFDDGVTSACGLTDNWLFLDLVRRPDVAAWLAGSDIQLGNSDREAVHWLVADGRTGEVYAADRGEARRAVYLQETPG